MSRTRKSLACVAAVATALGLAASAGTALAAEPEGVVEQAKQPVAGQYVVSLKDGMAATANAAAIEQAAVSLAKRYGGELKSTFTASMHGFSVRDMSEGEARRLAADPSVKRVFQDGTAKVADTQNDATYGIDRTDQVDLPLDTKYTYANTASGVTAYIIDTGIRYSHEEFGGRATTGYDFVDTDPDANDCNGHGTHVSGTVGGKTWGLAKEVKLVGVKVLGCGGSAPDSDSIEGIEWVTKNAAKPAVVNMSLTFDTKNIGDDAIAGLVGSGVSAVVAAGNAGSDACNTGPAYLPEAITVGATDNQDNRAGFSNLGSCLDLFAPGNNITSASHQDDTGNTNMSGTSMASPHVAGVAALYLQTDTAATPAQVSEALTGNASKDKVKNPGSGSPNLLLYSGFIGAGEPQPPNCDGGSNAAEVAIPDAGKAVESTLVIKDCEGTGRSGSTVDVAVTHPYSGDLQVELVSPSGAVSELKKAGGSSGIDLRETYTVDTSAESKNGTWTLRVTDLYRFDTGTIDSFGIKF